MNLKAKGLIKITSKQWFSTRSRWTIGGQQGISSGPQKIPW